MKNKLYIAAVLIGLSMSAFSQENLWSMDECMKYAVENSPKVKKAHYQEDNYKADRLAAFGSFLPSIGAETSAQYNYGRSIDPETNTYINTSTFNNSYGVYSSVPLFTGGRLVNQWRMVKFNSLLGKQESRLAEDELAINAMQAYIDAVFCRENVKLATETLGESKQLLRKTQLMEEIGLRGKADVAEIEAQVATNDYNLTNQENRYKIAILTLKEMMNYDASMPLALDTTIFNPEFTLENESTDAIFAYALENNPKIQQASMALKVSQMQQLIEKGRILPTISLYAGVSTNYYENLTSGNSIPFNSQFKNNRGEYFGVAFSVTLFDRFNRVTSIRKARNNMNIALEQQNETKRQLQISIEKAIADRDGFEKEIIQMERQVNANNIVYLQSMRKYEEGLMDPIDLQTNTNKLVESKIILLQKRLMHIAASKQVDYYNGKPLIN